MFIQVGKDLYQDTDLFVQVVYLHNTTMIRIKRNLYKDAVPYCRELILLLDQYFGDAEMAKLDIQDSDPNSSKLILYRVLALSNLITCRQALRCTKWLPKGVLFLSQMSNIVSKAPEHLKPQLATILQRSKITLNKLRDDDKFGSSAKRTDIARGGSSKNSLVISDQKASQNNLKNSSNRCEEMLSKKLNQVVGREIQVKFEELAKELREIKTMQQSIQQTSGNQDQQNVSNQEDLMNRLSIGFALENRNSWNNWNRGPQKKTDSFSFFHDPRGHQPKESVRSSNEPIIKIEGMDSN